jgi:hypothetical protein
MWTGLPISTPCPQAPFKGMVFTGPRPQGLLIESVSREIWVDPKTLTERTMQLEIPAALALVEKPVA